MVNNILYYDYANAPFQFLKAEEPFELQLPNGITINGKIDRMDTKAGLVRVIDYKTGYTDLEYKSMEDVFGVSPADEEGNISPRKKGKSQILQTMLYCWAVSEQYPAIAPYVYSVRRISDISTTTCVHAIGSNEPIVFDEQMKKEFVDQLVLLVDEIRNLEMPFYPCINDNVCKSCSFISLCGR